MQSQLRGKEGGEKDDKEETENDCSNGFGTSSKLCPSRGGYSQCEDKSGFDQALWVFELFSHRELCFEPTSQAIGIYKDL